MRAPSWLQDVTAFWDGELEAAQATQVDQHGGRIEQRRLWVSDLLAGTATGPTWPRYADWNASSVPRAKPDANWPTP